MDFFAKYTMNKKIIITALFFGIISIIFGAFGAHALKKVLTVEQLTSFETGVRYQMYYFDRHQTYRFYHSNWRNIINFSLVDIVF